MIPVTSRNGQRIALFGLGGSGIVTAKALMAGDAEVFAYDDNPKSVKAAAEEGIQTSDFKDLDFSRIDALVLAPGVPFTHPKPHWSVDLASTAGIPIIGDVGLFAEERRKVAPQSRFIAITGTNGKSTTTALISHILASAGKDVQMGGNIGKAVLSLEPLLDNRIYVIECSSYQIDLAPGIDPSSGILLNLAPDHLDRHGTMEHYAAVKERLVAGSKIAIIGQDDNHSRDISERLSKEHLSVWGISNESVLEKGAYMQGDEIWSSLDGYTKAVGSVAGIATLRGKHNAQNACAAYAACKSVGLTDLEIQTGMDSFPGLAHRMEIIGNVGTTVFVNDSKGTNADAAAMALSSFENIFWIAGGLAKEGGIDSLRPFFDRIAKAFLIGQAAPQFAATLGAEVEFEIADTLDNAVRNAAVAAEQFSGDAVVLLSPACASFDQYRNFELRGDAFKQEVMKLDGLVAYGSAQ